MGILEADWNRDCDQAFEAAVLPTWEYRAEMFFY